VSELRERLEKTLHVNDRGRYTVPSPRLYPYQWLWDSGFIALGWATFDEKRAWTELETLLAAQWENGMVPHIVFHDPNPDYFPGPELWQAKGPIASSGISQPPVLATVVRRLFEKAKNRALAARQARELYPKLYAFHRWCYRARDPEGTGLIAVLHPWESGMDNSPLWDEALARVPGVPVARLRRDTDVVASEQRPHASEYERYLGLVAALREVGYSEAESYRASPFRVVCALMNAVLQRANRDLLALAETLGEPKGEVETWIARGDEALMTLWNEEDGLFYPRDLVSGETIRIPGCDSFTPLFAGASGPWVARLAKTLASWQDRARYLLPSIDPAHERFEAKRYWRGPVWIQLNWLLAQGLSEHGFDKLAERLKRDSFALVERSGVYEYFDPHTGDGLGGESFAWTAALLLDWLEGDTA
jgi:hypothetical protein